MENLGIRTHLGGHRRGQYGPPIVLLRIGQSCHLHHQMIAHLRRWWVRFGWTSPPRSTRATGLGHDARASRMIPPGAWVAAASSLAPALIRRDSRCGIRCTRTPLGWHVLGLRHDCFGFLGLRGSRGLGVLRRQWARMHDHKATHCACDPSVAVLHFHLPAHPWSMPTAWCLVLGPPRLLHEEGQRRWLLSPGCELLPDSARARDEG